MRTLGSTLVQIQDDINEKDATDYAPIIRRAISRAYKIVVGEHMWRMTLKEYAPDDSDVVSTSHPFLLPADLKRIKSVRDANYTYYEDFTRGNVLRHQYNWFYGIPNRTVLQDGLSDMTFTQESKAVTSTGGTFDTGAAGEWITLGDDEDVYLIATRTSGTALVLAEEFRGETVTGSGTSIIRPMGIQSLSLVTPDKTLVSPTTLKIVYQAQPLSLTVDKHPIMLPDDAAEAVYIKAKQLSMQRKGWARAAKGFDQEYLHCLSLGKREEPGNKDDLKPLSMFSRPRNKGVLDVTLNAGR